MVKMVNFMLRVFYHTKQPVQQGCHTWRQNVGDWNKHLRYVTRPMRKARQAETHDPDGSYELRARAHAGWKGCAAGKVLLENPTVPKSCPFPSSFPERRAVA